MPPIAILVGPLERVVEEMGAEGRALGEVAVAEEDEGFRSGYLVNVGDDEDVASAGGLVANETRKDGVEEGVALVVFTVPGGTIMIRVGFDDAVDNLVRERGEARPAIAEVEWLFVVGEGLD